MIRANLIGEMAKRGITISAMADFLGLHRNSIRNKLYGVSHFTLDEAIAIFDQYFPDCNFRSLFDGTAV